MIKSKNYEEGSALYVLAKFCEAIKITDWVSALDFSTYAFQKNTKRPIDYLKGFHGGHKVKDISLSMSISLSHVVFKSIILIEALKTNGNFTYTAEVILVKQDRKRCLAHESGDWGVDPESFRVLGVIQNKEPLVKPKKTTVSRRTRKK